MTAIERFKIVIYAGILICLVLITLNLYQKGEQNVILEPNPNQNVLQEPRDIPFQISMNKFGIIIGGKEILVFNYDPLSKDIKIEGRFDYSNYYKLKLDSIDERYASFAEQDPYTYAIANHMGMYSTIRK